MMIHGIIMILLYNVYDYGSIKINPLSLNITNSLDLIEKLKPLFPFTLSHLEKFKSVNTNPTYGALEIDFRFTADRRIEWLFNIEFKLRYKNIFRKINSCIEKELKKKKRIIIMLLPPTQLK